MKDKTIKVMAERVGQTRAEKFWALFVERLCDGIEPEDGDTFKREDIEKRFENNPVARDAFIAVLCGEQKPDPKGRKFKADKARAYSAAEVVAFIAADPKTEGLRAEYMRRTDGQAALFYVDGKLVEPESADRIQRLFERDPVAPFVLIGGREVTPVGYPDDAAKEDREDPYQHGVALGQPGDVSERLGVSLADVGGETRQAIRCAVEHDLADASLLELQRDAEAAKGKGAAVYLMNKPLARRAWPTWPKPTLRLKRRPKAPVPFVEPSAPTAPREGIKAVRGGYDRDSVYRAIVGLALDRDTLVRSIDPRLAGQIPTSNQPAAQVLLDLTFLDRLRGEGTTEPLRAYLTSALALSPLRRESAVFRTALEAL